MTVNSSVYYKLSRHSAFPFRTDLWLKKNNLYVKNQEEAFKDNNLLDLW